MFATTLAAEIIGAKTLAHLDRLSKQLWSAFGSGAVPETEAQRLSQSIHDAQAALRVDPARVGTFKKASIFRPRRPQRTPSRPKSIERRRRLAAAGGLEPSMAASFTQGELAVLTIVADEVRRHGLCALAMDAIAAMAGVCRTLAQNAIRAAAKLGLLVVTERRHKGRKNETNLVRIVSSRWLGWLKRGLALVAKISMDGVGLLFPTPRNTSSGRKQELRMESGRSAPPRPSPARHPWRPSP